MDFIFIISLYLRTTLGGKCCYQPSGQIRKMRPREGGLSTFPSAGWCRYWPPLCPHTPSVPFHSVPSNLELCVLSTPWVSKTLSWLFVSALPLTSYVTPGGHVPSLGFSFSHLKNEGNELGHTTLLPGHLLPLGV